MNQKQAGELATITALLAKMSADPAVVRYEKLKKFAESMSLRLEPEGEKFVIRNPRGQVIYQCDTTEELNEWFKEYFMETVL